ncbi:UDP-N-acetyl-D-mannosamine dehydrogenase [Methylibium petroleiphilum]|uniref:UDP-N-acetyl-D-mannosamine dehydrogenase n=1 Tax=Methylibium petroleiphilum TaxID=105560 RepID=UPI001ACA0471|nr:UDP-N-acetyl-D-mannosamine dehydrogenase [Methylibium petroleiphilum]MBN9204235.1 UDP-N-acetyl-D-mannosamine dehydrogenase [Methylibium petroleiphilum]
MNNSKSFDCISMIGLGYIGLPTAAMFAARRKKVIGVDINPHAVDTINQGRIHIVEPELDMIVRSAVTEGFLRATTAPEPADAFLVAVPTPFKDHFKPDVSYVQAAAESIASVLRPGNLVILESTSPVGTTEQMVEWLRAARPDLRFPGPGVDAVDVNVAYCPERVLPGHVVRELVENDRIIGGLTAECSARAVTLYRTFVQGELLVTNARTAEMCKLTENSFRDVNIAFANELSIICDKLDIDVWELIRLANHHPRVKILQPGAGVGGHCIAVDPWFIVDRTPAEARLIRIAREVNDSKPAWVLDKVRQAIRGCCATPGSRVESDLNIAVLGLAFKPNIDDLRESPALHVAEQLMNSTSAKVQFVEPNIESLPRTLSTGQLANLSTALVHSDIVVVLVSHREFSDLASHLRPAQIVIDAVGVLR